MENKNPAAGSPLVEIGRTGLTRFGGWISEEWLKDLQGAKGIKIYKEMRDNCPITGAILFAIEMLIRQATWHVEAAGITKQDEEAKDFLESCLYDMSMSWPDTLSEILSFLTFGFSWHEIVYKQRQGDSQDPTKRSKFTDGRIGWRKLPIRAQETLWQWGYDEKDDSLISMKQQPPPDYILREIPLTKSLLFRTKSTKNNPEGKSLLRSAYRPWYYKKNIEEIEAIGVERDLAGLPVVELPANLLSPYASEDEKAAANTYKEMVTKLRRDEMEGVVFPASTGPDGNPTGYKLSLLSAGGSSRRQFDTTAIIQRYERAIAMTVLADFILLGHEKVGSYALMGKKSNLFGLACEAILDSICEVINSHGVPRLFALNSFSGLTGLPQLGHGEIEAPDLKEIGEFITSMSNAGATLFPDDDLENYLRQQAGFPEKPKDEQPKTKPVDQGNQEDAVTKLVSLLSEVRKRLAEEEP